MKASPATSSIQMGAAEQAALKRWARSYRLDGGPAQHLNVFLATALAFQDALRAPTDAFIKYCDAEGLAPGCEVLSKIMVTNNKARRKAASK